MDTAESRKKVRETFKVSDILINNNEGGQRRGLLPFTRYEAILGRPRVVTEDNIVSTGAPFHLLKQDTVTMSIEDVRKLCGDIL